MRSLLLLLIIYIPVSGYCQVINFEDDNFKRALVNNLDINTDGDSEITVEEAANYSGGLQLDGLNISSLKGINHFKKTIQINCVNNNLKELVLDSMTSLRNIFCASNQLEILELQDCTNLRLIDFNNNNLTEFNPPKTNTLLFIHGSFNQLEKVDLSGIPNLQSVKFRDNNLSKIDLSENSQIVKLDVGFNNLADLDVTNLTKLKSLECYQNPINDLNLDNNNKLDLLQVYNTNLTDLNLTAKDSLTYLKLLDDINDLDLTECPLLSSLNFSTTQEIMTIDISHNPLLKTAIVSSPGLTKMNFFDNPNIERVNIQSTQIRDLDLSNNPKLTSLALSSNELSFLNIANGNSDSISVLNLSNNSDELCVKVDSNFDIQRTRPNWIYDSSTSFTEGDCGILNSSLKIDSLVLSKVGCLAEDYGSIAVYASGGVPPYMYDISFYDIFQKSYTSQTDSSYLDNLLFTGEVLVTVTDSLGTTITQSDTLRYGNRENLFSYEFSKDGFELIEGNDSTKKVYEGDLCEGDTLIISIPKDDASFYQWNTGTFGTSDTITSDGSGFPTWYVTTIYDSLGCYYSLFAAVNNIPNGEGDCMSVSTENNNQHRIHIYPNPVNDVIMIEDPDLNQWHFEIYNSEGRSVFSKRRASKVTDISHLNAGFYLIRLTNKEISVTKKIMKI